LKIKELSDLGTPFDISFEEISKNQGISFICVDPTETFLQLIHHCHVIGGSWANPLKTSVGIRGTDKNAKPIQLILKSVKTVKTKMDSLEELMSGETANDQNKKSAKVDLIFRNILPIPHVLTKDYLKADSFASDNVAQSFYLAMKTFDAKETENFNQVLDKPPALEEENQENSNTLAEDEKSTSLDKASKDLAPKGLLQEFVHILQFCQLAYKKKIPPISYSVDTTTVIDVCFQGISFTNLKFSSIRGKRQQQRDEDSSVSDDDISSPEHKISKKDRVFLITMMKVNEAMDKTTKKNPTRNQALVDWRSTAKISF